jgi:hypothetical protein
LLLQDEQKFCELGIKAGKYFLNSLRIKYLVQSEVTDDVPVVVDIP